MKIWICLMTISSVLLISRITCPPIDQEETKQKEPVNEHPSEPEAHDPVSLSFFYFSNMI
jgi:hypothetical protein